MKNSNTKKVKLSSLEKVKYFSSFIVYGIVAICLEIYFHFNGMSSILLNYPIIYGLLLLFALIDTLTGIANLKYEKLDITLTNEKLDEVLEIMIKVRNWTVDLKNDFTVEGKSFNPKYLWNDTVSFKIIRNDKNIEIASYLTPSLIETKNSTAGERKRNIKYFELAAKFVLNGERKENIPRLIEETLKIEEWNKSEISLEVIGKRVIAYTIILGLFFVTYNYRDTILFIPFSILPIIGVGYIVIDIMTIKAKSNK